ncbi:hypothetical protein A2392_00525 [Candidatus Kaiserbacteria bacterium RIFOXYB1_FULL_46_14]|uniref:Uncharacterized protein n=1 Tax=Candidatus Kaiserbacteria bacterium RIFOXYB1_FULL_46_14 TaxID=1798531 RepID=A0A1F6FJ40_9BACT|nr:MAG: hypothetical protein A2392_00525 [Candidatus Kaiserbacteria bacterium RIFOXYB1_FULL_46_14]
MIVHTEDAMYYLKAADDHFEVTRVDEDARIAGVSILPNEEKWKVQSLYIKIGEPARFDHIITTNVLMVID